MTFDPAATVLELRSLVTDGTLTLSLARVAVREPGANEVVVRVQATPINPSDLGLMIGPADMTTARCSGSGADAVVTATIPDTAMPGMASRIGESMPVGNEGAGMVVAAGSSDAAQALLGRTVAVLGGAMYARVRVVDAGACLPLPPGTRAADGASAFVNPLTALGMVETMRIEGHRALVHTAAASNLGQILNRLCIVDGIGLVCIVRSPAQAALLREQGAAHICDSSAPGFMADLQSALVATGATIAFDAIGGGTLAGQILTAMEGAINTTATGYSRYGSSVHKQVYIYGSLDPRPTALDRRFGFVWGIGGWLLTPFLQRIGADAVKRLQARVASELTTTFASHYTRTISLVDTLDLDILAAYNRRATGEKYLIDPSL